MIIQDIKRRIRSVGSTQQITRAMKFVAAAKLHRSQERMLAMRPYADSLDLLVRHLAADIIGDEHPLFIQRDHPARIAYVIIAGDRGLCGGFNSNILKAAMEFVKSKPDAEPMFFAIGKNAAAGIRKAGHHIYKSYHDVFEKLSYVLAGSICDQLVELFTAPEDQRIDEAYVIYSEFMTMLTQKPVVRKLIPVDYQALKPQRDAKGDIIRDIELPDGDIVEEVILESSPDDIFDEGDLEEELLAEKGQEEAAAPRQGPPRPIYELLPNPGAALEKLIARRMATSVYRGMLESYAAELAARMTAMDNATSNAEDMIAQLTLSYNRARQTGITSELIDIIGGANALG